MTLAALPPEPHRLTLGDLANLPPVLDGHQTAEILGCSYWSLLELVKRGDAPVAPLRLGRAFKWPTVAVLRAIGIDPTELLREPARPSGS